jgi:hypothetical protein
MGEERDRAKRGSSARGSIAAVYYKDGRCLDAEIRLAIVVINLRAGYVSLRNHPSERGQTLHAEPITPIPNYSPT